MDCIAADHETSARTAVPEPAFPPPGRSAASGSLCVACDVRTRCLGGIAAEAGTVQLKGILTGRQSLLGREVLYRPGDAFATVYVVRSGSLISTREDEGAGAVVGFHFPGEVVGADGMVTGRQRVTTTALEETQLCALRFAPRNGDSVGARAFLARLWDMMSCGLVRERAHQTLLATLPPAGRLAAFLESVKARMSRPGQRRPLRLPLGLTAFEIASYLRVPPEAVDAVLIGTRS